MNNNLAELIEELEAAKGLSQADLLISNINILDVFSERIYPGSLLIKNGKIIALNSKPEIEVKAVFDGKGLVAVPGFIDTHMHLDSTLVTPEAIISAVLPHGTTSIMAEVLDFTSMAGEAKTKVLLQNKENWPCHVFLSAPGKMSPPSVTESFLLDPEVTSLGEILPAGILDIKEEELQRIIKAKELQKIITGHVGRYAEEELDMFALAGLMDDHEAWSYEQVCSLLQHGLSVMIRDCGVISSVEEIIKGVVENKLPTDKLIFCSDDIYINELVKIGHINSTIKKAIKVGLDPIKAVKIATINAAKHFRLEDKIGSLTPGKSADIVLLNSLEDLEPVHVFAKGRLVVKDKILLEELKGTYPELYSGQMPRGLAEITAADLLLKSQAELLVPVLDARQQIITRSQEAFLPENGVVNPKGDLQRFSIIERYPEEKRNILNGFVRGFNLQNGALAILFTQGGHKINVVGSDEENMCLAAKEADKYPGALVAVKGGEVIAVLPLPLECVLSDLSALEATEILEKLQKTAKDLGCNLPAPFLTLWFLPFYLR